MTAVANHPPAAVPAHGGAHRTLNAVLQAPGPLPPPQSPMGPLTAGLADILQGLGHGTPATGVPQPRPRSSPFETAPAVAQAQAPAFAPAPAPAPLPATAPVTGSDSQPMSVEQLLRALQPQQDAGQPGAADGSLEAVRTQMFGRYYQELEGRMAELRQVVEGGVARARRAMLERVDELGAALHRDMVALRQETQKELEDLKRDVFTTVMSLSAINDKLGLADSRNRETWMAVTKALTDRIEHQSRSTEQTLGAFRASVDEALEGRVARTVERILVNLAQSRRAGGTAPVASTAGTPATAPVA